MKNSYFVKFNILFSLGLLLISLGTTYSMFEYRKESTKQNFIKTGSLTFDFSEEETNSIYIENAFPITDRKGVSLSNDDEVYEFTIYSDDNSVDLNYEISLLVDSNVTNLDTDVVKIYLTEVDENNIEKRVGRMFDDLYSIPTYNDYLNKSNGVIESNSFVFGGPKSRKYKLRMWLDKNTEYLDGYYENKVFSAKVVVNSVASYDFDIELDSENDECLNSIYIDYNRPLVLPDNSIWYYLTNESSYCSNNTDDTIKLIYSEYIDNLGNYVDTPVNISKSNISSILSDLSVRLSNLINYDNINIHLPSGFELTNEDFNSNYNDDYYTWTLFDLLKNDSFYLEDEYKNGYSWFYNNGSLKYNSYSTNIGIKPVIELPISIINNLLEE